MPKYIVLSGSIIKGGKSHAEGSEIELAADEAAFINRKGKKLEPVELRDAKAKAAADAAATIAKAEQHAAEKHAKGGGK